ncbi:VOC family protein [Parasphingorhabdus halotolerans]|uniref:Glyoxalase n=1 Tax=Parasphingorhabdus halotolerans TaxID=2725558 RepID=A0A6H2DKT3_9SPHN|nr:VOC family protein [Parasphingorhabdus halotolerans]QJB68808.1 glyoxalase [Parasphingorhabdus halotolerans]
MGIKGLGYVVIETTDLSKWHDYLTGVVGAMADGKGADGAALYRIDARAARFRIIKADADRFAVAGWELADQADFDAMADKLRDAGCEVADGDAASRGVEALASGKDPAGHQFEIFHGAAQADTAFQSPAGVSGFVTGDLGMGHVVYGSLAFEETHKFYRDVMGFGDSDLPEIEVGPPGTPKMGIAFMHAETGRHHSVAVIQMPAPPTGCVHIMVEAKSRADVDKAYERMAAADVPVSATLGEHTNDQVTSFYMQTPGGFDLEFGFEGLVIDPATWEPTAHTTPSQWGHEWAWQKAAAEAATEEANG